MRVALVFPPQWTTAQPYFALASLAGHLQRAGHEVVIHDLNVAMADYVLSPSTLRLSQRRVVSALELLPVEVGLRLGTGDGSARAGVAALRLKAIEDYLAAGHGQRFEAIVEGARAAGPALRDPARFYAPATYVESMQAIDEALKLYSLPFHPAELSWNFFVTPQAPFNLGPLVEFARSRTDNPFRAFYDDHVRAILDDDPDLIALSINAFSQVVPGLTLAHLLREAIGRRGAGPHLTLGGNFFSRLEPRLRERPAFFEHFADSVAIGEGERALVTLADALDPAWPTGQGPSLASVPSLLYPDGSGGVASNPRAKNFAMDEMAFQSLDGFPLERYLSPDRVLCVRASKTCYYGHCTFCDAAYGLEPDVMQTERLVAELAHLGERYGVTSFEFVDQCIAPAYLEQMSDAILRAGLDIRWFCNARTEPGFTPKVLEKAKRAGATMIMWGLESGSPRLLKLMKKGVSADGRLDVLRASTDAGLFNFAYVFFGFPTESELEADQTIELIHRNTDLIHAYGRSVFSLGKHSPLMSDPERYGVLSWIEDSEELSTNLSFELSSGLVGPALQAVLERCTARCREAYGDPLWMALRSRETLHLYLARYGRDWVRSGRLRDEPDPDRPSDPAEPAFVF